MLHHWQESLVRMSTKVQKKAKYGVANKHVTAEIYTSDANKA